MSTSIELVAPPLRGPRRNTVPSALGGGRYEVLERIGEGGMAVVYRAFDRQLGRTVALKTVSELGSRELFRLKREFRVLADLQHRNLVQFHDLVVGPNQCFFTMELLSGDDFLTYVRGGPCTPPSVAASPAAPDTLDWERSTNDLETVCAEEASPALDHCQPVRAPRQLRRLRTATVHLLQGLRALHERGLVHRDVKPANVVVESAGRTVLVDFGLSRGAYAVGTVDGESDAVRVEGTAFYMAPEQAMGGEVGTPADVYSVGVMLYQLLSGRLPFDGSVARVLRRKCARDPDELERIVSGAPVELAELTMAMLSRDPAARPTVPEILSILEGGIGDESGFAMPVRRPRDRFVGREEELGALRAAFEESRELRQPRVLLLQGPSGMGKSALLDRFCRQLEGDARPLILRGRCHPHESVPYKALDHVVDALSSQLLALPPAEVDHLVGRDAGPLSLLFPVLARVPAIAEQADGATEGVEPRREVRRRGVRAFRGLVSAMTLKRDVVIVIDDVQWTDAESIDVLGGMLDGSQAPGVLLVLCGRAEATDGPLVARMEELDAERSSPVRFGRLELGPLPAWAARKLVERHTDHGMSDPGALTLVEEADGNPWLLEAVGRHLRDARPGLRASHLRDVLAARLAEVPPHAQRCLQLLAMFGAPAPQRLASALAAAHGGDGVLTELRQAGLVRRCAGGQEPAVELVHDRIRRALLQGLPAAVVRARHRALATVMEDLPDIEPGLLAHHYRRAGDRLRAGEYGLIAARRAFRSMAFDRAATLFRYALAAQEEPALSRAVGVEMADALAAAGRAPESARILENAAELVDDEEGTALRQLAAERYIGAGHLREGRALLARVAREVGLSLAANPWLARAQTAWRNLSLRLVRWEDFEPRRGPLDKQLQTRIDVCWTLAGCLGAFDPVRARAAQALHLRLAIAARDPSRLARALSLALVYERRLGGATRREADLREALEAVRRWLPHDEDEAFVLVARGYEELHAGRYGQACESLDAAEQLYARRGAESWGRALGRTHRLVATAALGDFAKLAPQERELANQYEASDDRISSAILTASVSTPVDLASGRPDRARERLRRALEPWEGEPPRSIAWRARLARARIELYDGLPGAAWKELRTAREARPAFASHRMEEQWLLALATLRSARRRDTWAGRRLVARCRRRIRACGVYGAEGFEATISAGLAQLDGHTARACAEIDRARRAFAANGMAAHAAAARLWGSSLVPLREATEERQAAVQELRRLGVRKPSVWMRSMMPPMPQRSLEITIDPE